jgi:hypothetical protein
MKILHYLRNLGLGGTEKTCQLFFENASPEFECVLVHEATGDKTRLAEFQSAGQVIEVDSYNGDPQSKPDSVNLQRVIDTVRPDVMHVYRSGYPEFPEIGTHIEVPHLVETNVFGFIDANLRIDKTLFMSKWLMDASLAKISMPEVFMSRFDYVNNPVEFSYTQEDCRKALFPEDSIILGRCGRPDNGIYNSVSVKAAHLLRMQGYDVRFFIMAPPSNMIADLDELEIPYRYNEPTTDPVLLSKFYNTIDIYAHARVDGETFGVNIAEAMMHGKPVVTHFAEPSMPGMGVFQSQTELVDDGETGYVLDNDPAAYARALKTLIDNKELRLRMGERGRVKAEREYHVDVCVKKLENIYLEIMSL